MKPYVNHWIENYSSKEQFCDLDLIKQKSEEQKDGVKTRKCTENMFYRRTKTGEVLNVLGSVFRLKLVESTAFFANFMNLVKTVNSLVVDFAIGNMLVTD